MKIFRYFFFFITIVFLLAGCGGSKSTTVYRVGIDPTFYPLRLKGKEAYVFAFTNELLKEIGALKKITFVRVNMSWDNLLWGLKEKKYDAMISSMQPYVFNLKKYAFSDLFLRTGPVLVVRVGSMINSLEDLSGKDLAIEQNSDTLNLLAKYPQIQTQFYLNIPDALDQLSKGKVEGVLVGNLFAKNYIQDFFDGQLTIVSPPMTEEGLRLITLSHHDAELTEIFNEGLMELKKSGRYNELLVKWNLGY